MTDARNVPRERVEQFIEEIHAAEGDYGIGLAITAMEAYMDAAPPARECAICHSIVDAYDARSELFTNDADCAGNLADKARAGLAAGAAPAAEPCYYCGRVHSEADPYCVKPAAEPAPDQSAAMRPREQEISQRMDTGYAQVADPVDALCALLEEDAREETQRGNRITAQYEREAAAALRTLQQERDHHKKMRELGWSWLSCPMCGEELSGEYKERGELRAERDKLQERVAELELDKSGLARTSVNLLQSLAKAEAALAAEVQNANGLFAECNELRAALAAANAKLAAMFGVCRKGFVRIEFATIEGEQQYALTKYLETSLLPKAGAHLCKRMISEFRAVLEPKHD